MKFRFSQIFVQNLLLLGLLVSVLGGLFFLRDTIESFNSQALFFWLVMGCALIGSTLLFLLSCLNRRAKAIATSRTSDLLQTQKLFVELYRNSPVPYVLVDKKGLVTYPNHAAMRLFGLEEATFAGQDIFELLAMPDDTDESKLSLLTSRFYSGVSVENKEVLVKRPDQSTRFGLLSIFPYGDGFSAGKKGLMTIVDVTKQKEVENAKSEFVSFASHQLRTPISSIKWNLELLVSPQFGTLSKDQHDYFAKVVGAVQKMQVIIEDFLSVSQLELGAQSINIEPLDLPTFCDETVHELQDQIEAKNLTLKKQYDTTVETIQSDRRLLHMILNNLLSNAVKYSRPNGVIGLHYAIHNDTCTIQISDSGVGIPVDDQDKLFTKFFRASNVRDQKIKGTGLGLYITKLAVQKLGGRISVDSSEETGTIFTVIVPVTINSTN